MNRLVMRRCRRAIQPVACAFRVQKKMRLNEARRLMLTEHLDASTTAYKVGYDSPSQFSREYNRQFGSPPIRDIKNLIQVTAPGS